MKLCEWEERYRSRLRADEDFSSTPAQLVSDAVRALPAGRALDLACGTGRNALWLAERGWKVTAVDGATEAIEVLRRQAQDRGLTVDARLANLERSEYSIVPESWDLICMCYYLQRDLFEVAKRGLAPGGILIGIVHIAGCGEQATATRLVRGELAKYFRDMEILHDREGRPNDRAHERAVAEIVARRPMQQ